MYGAIHLCLAKKRSLESSPREEAKDKTQGWQGLHLRKNKVGWVVSHGEGGLVSLMKRLLDGKRWQKTSSHDILKDCGVLLWSQMLKQTPRSVDLGIVYSSQGLQRHQAQALPATLPQSPWRRCTFDWELSRLITRWVSGFYLAASLYLLPFHSWIRRNTRERETNRETKWESGDKIRENKKKCVCIYIYIAWMKLQVREGPEERTANERKREVRNEKECRGRKRGREKG